MKIQINGLDVWGNESDGWDINDVLGRHGVITVSDDATDIEIIRALVEDDIIYPGDYEIDDFCGEFFMGNLVDPATNRPLLQIKQITE